MKKYCRRGCFWGALGLALGIAYWIVEAAVDSFVLHEGSLVETLLTPGPDTLLKRVVFVAITTSFGFFAQSRIHRLQEAHESIRHQSLHDILTGLPNRALLYDRLAQALARAQRRESKFSVVVLDLDNFKDINDSFGHHVGDQLLEDIGVRLTGVLRRGDTIARWGGDEFVVLSTDVDAVEDVGVIVQRIRGCLSEPFVVEDHDLPVSASIGFSVYPDDGEDAETLLRKADVAMYDVKGKAHSLSD